MNFEELKALAKGAEPELKDSQSVLIITTEDIGPKVAIQTATMGTPMHLAQAIRSILADNPAIVKCINFITTQKIEEEAKKIKNEKNQAKYN